MAKDSIVLGGGCFWCLDAYYKLINGVEAVECGYSGSTITNPTYEQVCTGQTNHAEVVNITYNNKIISLGDILKIFWTMHDPTTLNKQGADEGTQYRSIIFYNSSIQHNEILRVKENMQKYWDNPIVTEITPLETFYKAEDYHQDYFKNIPQAAYCQIVINPKLQKLKKQFSNYLKT